MTKTIGVRSSRRSSTSSTRKASRNFASRLVSGSSIKNRRGRRTIARPIATRWISPPDSRDASRSRRRVILSNIRGPADAALNFRLGHAPAGSPQRKLEVSADGPPGVKREVLEHQRHVPLGRSQGRDILPRHEDRSGLGRLQPRDGSEQRRLSRAGRTEHDEQFVGARLQVDVDQRLGAPEALRQAANG